MHRAHSGHDSVSPAAQAQKMPRPIGRGIFQSGTSYFVTPSTAFWKIGVLVSSYL